MNRSIGGITIPSSYIVVITTIIVVYALLVTTFFEIDNALGEGENFVVDNNDNNNSKTTNETQQVVETQCKSPCPSNAEMCIEMCA